MCDHDIAVPFDESHFEQHAGTVWSDDHNHAVGLSEVDDLIAEGMENVRVFDVLAVMVGTLDDDRLVPHNHKLTCHKVTCQQWVGQQP